jgi:hypothetical protein
MQESAAAGRAAAASAVCRGFHGWYIAAVSCSRHHGLPETRDALLCRSEHASVLQPAEPRQRGARSPVPSLHSAGGLHSSLPPAWRAGWEQRAPVAGSTSNVNRGQRTVARWTHTFTGRASGAQHGGIGHGHATFLYAWVQFQSPIKYGAPFGRGLRLGATAALPSCEVCAARAWHHPRSPQPPCMLNRRRDQRRETGSRQKYAGGRCQAA